MSGLPLTRAIPLPDGRRLACEEYGDPQGHPTFYFHGFPGSRLEAVLAAGAARKARVRLIAIDRPGFGASDFMPGRRLLDWPADVLNVADELGLQRFSIVGVSGGGPYASVCAHAIADRLEAVAIVSGVAPMQDRALLSGMTWKNATTVRTAQRVPSLVPRLLAPAILLRAFPRQAMRALAASLEEPDRRVFARPAVLDALSHSLRESLRQGTRGHAQELLIIAQPWGFALQEIATPIQLWHGRRDPVVPPSHFDFLAAHMPHAHGELLPEEGHFSLVIDHTAWIFAALDAWRRSQGWETSPSPRPSPQRGEGE